MELVIFFAGKSSLNCLFSHPRNHQIMDVQNGNFDDKMNEKSRAKVLTDTKAKYLHV